MKKQATQSGFLIVEVIISMLILIIIVTAVYSSIGFFIVKSRQSTYSFDATMLLQESIEIAYNVLQGNGQTYEGIYWPVVQDLGYQGEAWALVEKSKPETGLKTLYDRQLEIRNICRQQGSSNYQVLEIGETCGNGYIDQNLKALKSTVSWQEHDESFSQSAELLVFIK